MAPFRRLEERRAECLADGVQLRETLLRRYMAKYGYTDRPFLKDVVDDLIEEELGARLRAEVLPLDRYAQSEVVGTRVVVSVNRRAGEIPGVKHTDGVIYVAKWHEAVHVDGHLKPAQTDGEQPPLPSFEDMQPRLIVCRGAGWRTHEHPDWEFAAEHGGLAAAIADADLLRCDAFHEFLQLAKRGGDLGGYAWRLLYETAARIGVNPPALVRYLEYRGLCRVVNGSGHSRLVADPKLFEITERLESKPSLRPGGEQSSLGYRNRPPGLMGGMEDW